MSKAVNIPRHVAIIMDGNGRWAKARHLPRAVGHKRGLNATRDIVQACAERGVEFLTVFAFSSENWQRPEEEVSSLMELFLTALKGEVDKLIKNNIRLRFIGDADGFSEKLRKRISDAETRTAPGSKMQFLVAANYGGRWDITEAARAAARDIQQGRIAEQDLSADYIAARLSTAGIPEPDLFIRTGGEQRISNFLLWQLAYTELYFTDVLWPDFSAQDLDKAFEEYANRQRRFGRTGEQVMGVRHA